MKSDPSTSDTKLLAHSESSRQLRYINSHFTIIITITTHCCAAQRHSWHAGRPLHYATFRGSEQELARWS